MPAVRTPLASQTTTPPAVLTDRDERATAPAVENRVGEPLRLGTVVASLRRTLWRTLARPPHTTAPVQGRESLPCQPTPLRIPRPSPATLATLASPSAPAAPPRPGSPPAR
ncbi:hypothetical protein [Streptomyces sp. NPDC090445]|uniref:hypothetical protein n=1 Tax=Streptomyces sp. NPDC090445 TaxID=3365963 RepID=UPI00381A47CF